MEQPGASGRPAPSLRDLMNKQFVVPWDLETKMRVMRTLT